MNGNISDFILEELKGINKKQSRILERLNVVEEYLNISNLEGGMGKDLPNVLTVKEMSKFLNVNTSRAYKLTHRSDFPSFKLGNKILIPRNKLLQWIDEKSEEWVD